MLEMINCGFPMSLVMVSSSMWGSDIASADDGCLGFQRSQPTRGGTVWQQQMPANRDQHLS